jgi:hypothetical protein
MSTSPWVDRQEFHMLDVVFVAITILFFIVSIGYVAACDRLMK